MWSTVSAVQDLLCSPLPEAARAVSLCVSGVGGATSPLDWLEANTVWRFHVRAADRERAVDDVLAACQGARLRFLVPRGEADGLGPLLLERGFRWIAEFRRLELDLDAPLPDLRGGIPPVREVRTREDLHAWFQVRVAAGSDPAPPGEELLDALERMIQAPSARVRMVCALDAAGGGVSVGGMMLHPRAGVGYLWAGCTVAHARGRGAYRAAVLARLRAARAAGMRRVVAVASPLSAPVLEGLGMRGSESWAHWVRPASGPAR